MINIVLNGEASTIDEAQTVNQAMQAWGYSGSSCAVAINESFVPRSQYDQTTIQSDDKIEVVSPLEGG